MTSSRFLKSRDRLLGHEGLSGSMAGYVLARQPGTLGHPEDTVSMREVHLRTLVFREALKGYPAGVGMNCQEARAS